MHPCDAHFMVNPTLGAIKEETWPKCCQNNSIAWAHAHYTHNSPSAHALQSHKHGYTLPVTLQVAPMREHMNSLSRVGVPNSLNVSHINTKRTHYAHNSPSDPPHSHEHGYPLPAPLQVPPIWEHINCYHVWMHQTLSKSMKYSNAHRIVDQLLQHTCHTMRTKLQTPICGTDMLENQMPRINVRAMKHIET